MATGRKPKPAALKILQGNPRRRLLPVEPPLSTNLKCPGWLDRDARREWKRLIAAFDDLGILKTTDQAILAAHCAAYSRWAAAEKSVAASSWGHR